MGQQTGRQTGALTAAEFLFTYICHTSVSSFYRQVRFLLRQKTPIVMYVRSREVLTYELEYSHVVLFIACGHWYFVKGKQLQYLLSVKWSIMTASLDRHVAAPRKNT